MYVDAKELEMAFISAMAKDMCDYGEDITLSGIVLTFDEVIEALENKNKIPDIKPKNDVNAEKKDANTKERHTPDYGTGVCEYCGKTYKKTSGNQKLCPECKEKKKSKNLEPFRGKAHSTTNTTLEHVNGTTPDDVKSLAHELAEMEDDE